MCSLHAQDIGDSVAIDQLLEQLQDGFFNNIILLCRLKDLLALTGPAGGAMPVASAAVRQPHVSKYEEAIAAVLHHAGHRLTFQPVYEGVQSRGHGCSKKTVQRYLKKMLRAGRIDHNSSGYGLTARPPEPSQPA